MADEAGDRLEAGRDDVRETELVEHSEVVPRP